MRMEGAADPLHPADAAVCTGLNHLTQYRTLCINVFTHINTQFVSAQHTEHINKQLSFLSLYPTS